MVAEMLFSPSLRSGFFFAIEASEEKCDLIRQTDLLPINSDLIVSGCGSGVDASLCRLQATLCGGVDRSSHFRDRARRA
jgi:hypothetical protein